MARKLIEQIPLDEAVAIAHRILLPEGLNSLQEEILRKSRSGETYEAIAKASGYSIQHVRNVGDKLWKSLSQVLGEKITKNNVQSALGKEWRERNSSDVASATLRERLNSVINKSEQLLKLP